MKPTAAGATDRARELHAAAVLDSDHGRPAVAVRRLRSGLALLSKAEPATGPVADAQAAEEVRARLLMSLAWAESERGRVELGLHLLDQAEAVVAEHQRAVLHAQRALLLKRQGRNDIALGWYDSAVTLLREDEHPLDLVKVLNNRSIALLEAGRVRAARADLQRCAEVARRQGFELHVAMSRVNLGCIDVVAGDLTSALRRFAQSRADYERIAPGRLPILAVEHARGLMAAGLFTDADRELATAVALAARQNLSHTHADALHARAEAALLAGRFDDAVAWARQARSRFVGRANERRAAVLSLLQLRAEAEAARTAGGDGAGGDDAASVLRSVADRARRLAPRLGLLGLPEDQRVAGLIAARALIAAGRTAAARQLLVRHGTSGRSDRFDTRLIRKHVLAELAFAEDRPGDAFRQLQSGLESVHRYRAQFGSFDLQTSTSAHGRELARTGLAHATRNGTPASVYRWSERSRAQALLLSPVRPPDDQALATALEELRQTQYTLRSHELAGRETGNLRSRVHALRQLIREHHWSAPALSPATSPVIAPLGQVRAELGGAALVSYLQDGDLLRALVVVADFARLVTLGPYSEVAELTRRLRADLDAQAGRVLPARLATAVDTATRLDGSRLGALLLDPLLPHVGDRPLIVVPTGVLATVAWSALPSGAGRPITVAPSATSWIRARQRSALESKVVLVAGPGNDRGAAEVQAIAGLYREAVVLTGSSATPAATLAACEKASLIHLAAHGHHQLENPLFSSLDLTGGPLFGYDIHDLNPAATVVLSACDLGLADVRPGDEPLGMSTAFLAAGASTVIASVARVADRTAMDIMVRCHRQLLDGKPPAAALAAASPAGGHSPFTCLGAG
ncbi:CHAT domain-containing protein [Kribbella sp. C-35]|uniref:CHAT domain-containing protein n=1 Tax=Kribbella sp. C-35 TaxID=2789276 RepID=UPI00397A7123